MSSKVELSQMQIEVLNQVEKLCRDVLGPKKHMINDTLNPLVRRPFHIVSNVEVCFV